MTWFGYSTLLCVSDVYYSLKKASRCLQLLWRHCSTWTGVRKMTDRLTISSCKTQGTKPPSPYHDFRAKRRLGSIKPGCCRSMLPKERSLQDPPTRLQPGNRPISALSINHQKIRKSINHRTVDIDPRKSMMERRWPRFNDSIGQHFICWLTLRTV